MSYEKIRIIDPTSVRNPETSYVYVGYGTYNEFTGMWIKEANGTISVISGGTGGGGGTNYWAKSGSDLSTGTAFGVSLVKINGANLYVDPAGTGTATSLQQLTVEGAIRLGTTAALGNYAGSIRYTGTDFEGYLTAKGWVSLTASGGTSGTAGTSYWTTVSYGIAPIDSSYNVYAGDVSDGVLTPSVSDEPINSYGGITLGKKSGKPNKEGTIYYTSAGYFVGVSGTSLTDRRLDTFNVAPGDRAYYNNVVLVGRNSAIETITGHISGSIEPKLNATGYTISDHIVTRYNMPTGVAHGGFGGFSGGTIQYGITKSISITDLGSLSDQPWGGGGVTQLRKGIDIVNGIITNFEITDGGAPANMRLTDYGLDGDAYSKSESDALYSTKSGDFKVDTENKATTNGEFIIATNMNLTVGASDIVTGKTFFVINTKAGSIDISADEPSALGKKAVLAQNRIGLVVFDGNTWSMAEFAFTGKTFAL